MKNRQPRPLPLLPNVHRAPVPPPDGAGRRPDRRPHGVAAGHGRLPGRGGDLRQGEGRVAEGGCAYVSGAAGVRGLGWCGLGAPEGGGRDEVHHVWVVGNQFCFVLF